MEYTHDKSFHDAWPLFIKWMYTWRTETNTHILRVLSHIDNDFVSLVNLADYLDVEELARDLIWFMSHKYKELSSSDPIWSHIAEFALGSRGPLSFQRFCAHLLCQTKQMRD